MANVSEFSTTAASNNSAAPNGAPEGMSPASVNDVIRENMAALAKWYKDQNGTITTGGTTTAYTLTTNNAHAALNDIALFAFQVNATNTGAATLNVDSLGAKSMNLNGSALGAGDLVADEIVLCVYNPDNDVFDIFKSGLSQSTIKADTISELTTANGVVIDGVTLKDGGITATGTVVAPTVDINAGAIDGTTIGGSTPDAGSFTTLSTSSNASITGNIAVSGTVDGRDIATDGAKLDNIEASADVTDATNVDAAGAVMNTDTSTASMSFVIDEDAMGSNLDTKVPTQQSVKAYVDDTVVAIGALSVSGTPVADDYARFTGAATIEGRSIAELKSDLSFDIDASVSLGLTAGTTQTQAGATAMTASINEFSVVANANDGGKLPDDTGIGEQVMVVNNGSEDLKVWPASGHSINSGATDAADTAVIASGGRRVYTKQTATNWAKPSFILSKGADVASATALTLGNDGNYFDITGTTTITSITTISVGTVVKLHFDDALTLTHHATDLILPGGANITTAAGDEAEFIEYAPGDWRCTLYTKASGEPVVAPAAAMTWLEGADFASDAFYDVDLTGYTDYDSFRIVYRDLEPSTGTSIWVGLSNSTTYAARNGESSMTSNSGSTVTAQGHAGNNPIRLTGSNTISNQTSGVLDLFGAHESGEKTTAVWQSISASGGTVYSITGANIQDTAEVTALIRITSGAANIFDGRVDIYGVKNS